VHTNARSSLKKPQRGFSRSVLMIVRSNQEVYMTPVPASTVLTDVLAYLQTNQYRRASFDRLISNIPSISTPDQLSDVVRNNPSIFVSITIAGGLPGLRIRDGWDGTIPVPAPAPEEGLAESDLSAPETIPSSELYVRKLIQRAADASTPHDAERFSQAALNTANAIACLAHVNNISRQYASTPRPTSAE
jgi:hypothetical protein